ncbi:multicopper oxidase domain-containing protein [Stigmatella hybrida]|uniref:multicopper oxidase domain-containing protein n=1 Tax=Stigmatella hybrida TaxID=394097 RepID=UPI001CDA831D|nr:multicopper oxidase domain-containing protein [Stigmatella hybrida]
MSPGGRTRWGLATGLTVGLLAWELLWVRLLTEGAPVTALTAGLAWDATLFLVLGLVASGAARPGPARAVPSQAARVALLFGVLLLPVAGARALLQERWAADGKPEATPGASFSALQEETPGDARFLCSIASSDAGRPPVSEGPAAVMLTGMRDALPLLAVVFPLALGVLGFQAWGRAMGALGRRSRWAVPGLLLVLLAAWGGRMGGLKTVSRVPVSEEARLAAGCAPGAPVRTYELAAIAVDIPLNAHGDHIPQGRMYVLEQEIPAVRAQERRPARERVSPGLGEDAIQPLVLRANLGECLVLSFTNRLAQEPAALHIDGLGFTVLEEASAEGVVPRMAIPAGQGLTYVVPLPGNAEAEGAYLLHDAEDARREAYGLFGALVLEPQGAVFRNPGTGAPSSGTGWQAIIDVPGGGQDFREAVLLSHALGPPEEAEVRLAGGGLLPTLNEMAGTFRPGAFGFNYRSEPFFERERDPSKDPEAPGPRGSKGLATPMPRSYRGEPVKLRMLQAGSAEFHAYALQGARGRKKTEEPAEVVQLLRPGRGLTVSQGPEQAGDFVFHCRMPNHSIGGMQGLWRVLEGPEADWVTLEERSGR